MDVRKEREGEKEKVRGQWREENCREGGGGQRRRERRW